MYVAAATSPIVAELCGRADIVFAVAAFSGCVQPVVSYRGEYLVTK